MIPHVKEFRNTIISVFDPKKNEHIGIVFDKPRLIDKDNESWIDRRNLVLDWFEVFQELSHDIGFSVDCFSFDSVQSHNKLLSREMLRKLSNYNVVIALTEFSITSSLVQLVKLNPNSFRCASLPGAERRMHDSVYLSDYNSIRIFAHSIKDFLDSAVSATISFSTGDECVIDLRNRFGGADDGDCTKPGSVINFPSGEGFIAPYEGLDEEVRSYGKSKTHGKIPFVYKDEVVKGKVSHNNFISFFSKNAKLNSSINSFFDMGFSRRNIAELGIGCNPNAQVTGNMFEDEKAGVHIAYGMSSHLGGKIDSDIHFDLVFAKGCPIEAEQLRLFFKDASFVDLVKDSEIQYDLLSKE